MCRKQRKWGVEVQGLFLNLSLTESGLNGIPYPSEWKTVDTALLTLMSVCQRRQKWGVEAQGSSLPLSPPSPHTAAVVAVAVVVAAAVVVVVAAAAAVAVAARNTQCNVWPSEDSAVLTGLRLKSFLPWRTSSPLRAIIHSPHDQYSVNSFPALRTSYDTLGKKRFSNVYMMLRLNSNFSCILTWNHVLKMSSSGQL